MAKVHAIRTGLVQVRRAQMERRRNGLGSVTDMLFDPEWTAWLPVYAWLIEHEEGLILVDAGETSRVHEHGYHPSWHPFYRRAVRFSVHPEEEIGPQLRALGICPPGHTTSRPHAPSHRSCWRFGSSDGQEISGIQRRMGECLWIEWKAAGLSTASMAEMVGI